MAAGMTKTVAMPVPGFMQRSLGESLPQKLLLKPLMYFPSSGTVRYLHPVACRRSKRLEGFRMF